MPLQTPPSFPPKAHRSPRSKARLSSSGISSTPTASKASRMTVPLASDFMDADDSLDRTRMETERRERGVILIDLDSEDEDDDDEGEEGRFNEVLVLSSGEEEEKDGMEKEQQEEEDDQVIATRLRVASTMLDDSPSSQESEGEERDHPREVDEDYPLPDAPWKMDVEAMVPFRNLPPSGGIDSVPDGGDVEEEWDWDWELMKGPFMGRGKGKEKESERQIDWHCASFFPYSSFEGFERLKNVYVVVGGGQVELRRLEEDATQTVLDVPLSRYHSPDDHSNPSLSEEFRTCAWSMNIRDETFWIPILAVAGRSGVILIFEIRFEKGGRIDLVHERTLTGHGGPIWDLKFSASHPHFLVSTSDDHTLRLWDATLPSGSNFEVSKRVPPPLRAGEKSWRPRVDDELLGILAEGGHESGVLSCVRRLLLVSPFSVAANPDPSSVFPQDIHPLLPLIVSSGQDAQIHLWVIPSSLRGPTWPSPSCPSPSLSSSSSIPFPLPLPASLGRPIFSTRALHPGQWTDQVLWASHANCDLIAKASRFSTATTDGSKGGRRWRRNVKLWTADVLERDVVPFGDEGGLEKRRREVRREWRKGEEKGERRVGEDEAFPGWGSSAGEFAFRVRREWEVEGGNLIGDKIACARRPLFGKSSVHVHGSISEEEDEDDEDEVGPEPFVVLPASDSLRLFWVYPTIPSLPNAKEGRPHEEVEAQLEYLFPKAAEGEGRRERPQFDLVPKGKCCGVLKGERGAAMRCVAVGMEGARWIVAVGDRGMVCVWRRRRREK